MFQGKRKAIIFSFDDGIVDDIRLIEIFNKYGLKRITLTAGQNRITVKYPQNALSIGRLCIYREKVS